MRKVCGEIVMCGVVTNPKLSCAKRGIIPFFML